jgi:Domain of unknown function DUF29
MRVRVEFGQLYERDFVSWTEEQAAALRRLKDSNLPLDRENLAEAIESLGVSQRTELKSQSRRIQRHLFKLVGSPSAAPRDAWLTPIRDARAEIDDILEDSPSLRCEFADIVRQQCPKAAKLAAADLAQQSETEGKVWACLKAGGFTAEQVTSDWLPDAA